MGSDSDMADKKIIGFLAASIAFAVIVIGHSLLTEGITTRVIDVEQNNIENGNAKKNDNIDPVTFTATMPEVVNEAGKAKPAEQYYKGSDNQIDCRQAPTFGDLVACESLKAQSSVDDSTVGIWGWTIVSSVFSIFAFCAAIASVRLLWNSNSETKKSNILQLQPWLNVARPEIVETDFKHIQFMTGEEGSFCFGIKFSITNAGKTPVTSICFDFINLTILIKTGRKHTFLKGDCSPQLRILSINPSKEPEDFIIYVQFTGEIVEAGWFTEVEKFLSGDHSIDDIFFIINTDIRFKDKFTPLGEHRCINVLAKNKIVRLRSGMPNKILRVGIERPDVDLGRFDIADEESWHYEHND